MKIGRKTERSVVQSVLVYIFLNFLLILVAVSYTATLPAMGQNNPKHPKLKEFFNKAKETIQSVRSYKPTWESYYKDGVKALQEKRYEAAQNHLEDALLLAEGLPDRESKVATTKQVLAICLRDKLAFIKSKIPFVPPIKGDLLVGMTIFFMVLGICAYGYANNANPSDPLWLAVLAIFLIVMGIGSTVLYGPLTEIERLETRLAELR